MLTGIVLRAGKKKDEEEVKLCTTCSGCTEPQKPTYNIQAGVLGSLLKVGSK